MRYNARTIWDCITAKLTKNDKQILAATRQIMDQYHIALAALAQGDSSLSMTKEFKQELVEATKNVSRYTIAGREATTEQSRRAPKCVTPEILP